MPLLLPKLEAVLRELKVKAELEAGPLLTEIGVIVYIMQSEDSLEATFALPQYEGELATETATRTSGGPGFAGGWDVKTYTAPPDKKLAMTGTLDIVPMNPDPEGQAIAAQEKDGWKVYWFKWVLHPEEYLRRNLGYAEGTHLNYIGVAMEVPVPGQPGDSVLVGGWSNNICQRVWDYDGEEWGQHEVCRTGGPLNPLFEG